MAYVSRKVRIAAWILGGLVAVVVLLVALLHTPPARRYALKQAVEILGKQGIRFDASEFGYNLLELKATLRNVEVRSPQAQDLPPLLLADRAEVDLSLRKLISGSYDIEDATIRNPRVHLVITEDGRDNIPRPPEKQPKSETKTDYFIDKLLIEGGSLRVEERRQKVDLQLPIDRITMDGDPLTRDHVIELAGAKGGTVAFESRTLPLNGLTANVLLQDNAADIRKFDIGLGDSTISLAGKIDNFDDPRFDVKANTKLSLGSLIEFGGVKQTARGDVNVALTATGPLAQIKAQARIDGQDLTLDKFDNLDVKAEAAYDAQSSRVRFDSLNVVSPSGTINGTADLALNAKAGESRANISTSGLDLNRLSSTLDLPVRLASRANAKIAARWPAMEFEKAAGDATVNLTATGAASRNVIPVSGTLNAKTQGRRIVVGIPNLRALDASMQGQVVLIDRNTLDGKLTLNASDLSRTIGAAERYLGRKPGTLAGTPVAGQATIVADLGGTIKAPAVNASIDSPALQVGELKGISIQGKADYNTNRLLLDDAVVRWQGQELRASGTVGLGRDQRLNLKAASQNVDIQSVLAALNRTDLPVSGSLTLDAQIGGTSKSPIADVNIAGRDLKAYNELFGDLTARARLDGDVVHLGEFLLRKPQEGGDGSLTASGSINIDSKLFALNAKSENLRLTTFTLPDGRPVSGRVDVEATSTGTPTDPTAQAQIKVAGLELANQQFGDISLNANVANRQAAIDASAPAFNLAAKANIGTDKPYPSTFTVRADDVDLQNLPVKIDAPVTGRLTATITGTAPLDTPELAQATAEVQQLDLQYSGQPIRSEGPLTASYANKVLTISNATLLLRDSRVALSGTLPLDATAGEGEIRLAAKLDLPTLVAYAPQQQITAQGTATIDGTIRGTLKRIDPTLNIALENGYFAGPKMNPPVSGATLRARVANGALQLDTLSASMGPASFTASALVPFGILPADLPIELPRQTGPAQLTANLNQLDLGTLDAVPEKVAGVISARIEASAPRADINAVTGKLFFPDLRLILSDFPLEQVGTSEVAFANGVATVRQFQLTGPETNLSLSGTAGLTGARALNLRVDGTTNAAVASAFSEGIRAQGLTELHASVSGTATQPKASGYLQLTDAELSVREPRIGLEGLNLRVDLAGQRATISQLTGSLNGGTLAGGGSLEFANGQLRSDGFNVKATGVYMDFPAGMKTVSDVTLGLRSSADDLIVDGNVVIVEGGFTDDLNFDRGILATVNAPQGIDLSEERNPLLENIRFNIGVRTDTPLIIDNNLAEAEVTADLRVLGNPYQPGLSGRLEIEEGGLLRFQEREYTVERGVITFANERRIEPGLDILATTSAGGFDIRMQISGTPGDTETILTSDPALPEPDILAVLLTGRRMEDIRGQEFEIARNQVLSYLTGRVGSQLGRGLEGATGLSTVRIEPSLIANEANPSARLTLGQDLTRNLELIYSMDLVNSSDQIYVLEYDITRRFTGRGVRQSDGSLRMDFRHDVRFGGVPEPRRDRKRENRRLGNITLLGNNYFTQEKILDKLKVETGDRYDFFKVRKGVDRIDSMFFKENLLESSVRIRRQETGAGGTVDLQVNVKPGPVVDFVYEGMTVPDGVQEDIRRTWQDGVFDRQRAEESIDVLRAWLVGEDYLRPTIEYRITQPAEGRKRITLDINPGVKYQNVELAFEGATGFEEDDLREVIESQKLTKDVYVAPSRVTELLTRYYQEFGYLNAAVGDPRYELDPAKGTGRVVFPVTEGPLFKVGDVAFEGNTVFNDVELAAAVPLPKGENYRPVLRQNALDRLRDTYWAKGYNDVDTTFVMKRSVAEGEVDLTFRIAENRQSVVRDIVIQGNKDTSERLISTQIELRPGDVLDLQKLGESRRNLYNTGAYSLIEIAREEIDGAAGEQTRARTEAGTGEKPIRLRVRVREIQPWQVRYGGFFDTERGPGVIVDVENRNLLGSARVAGLRGRYDSQVREARFHFTQPALLRFPVRTIVSPFLRLERNPATADSDPFNVDRLGFSIQQEATWRRLYILNYGYQLERTISSTPGTEFEDVRARIGSLTSTLTRESRDEVLDATRGSFMSHAVQFSPTILGSQQPFIKYFGQYFRYIPLEKERIELFTNQVLRPRLVFATGLRVGLAKGLGELSLLPASERFFAGGGTTVRAFEQNALGPIDFTNQPDGGNAMIVLNNEIRTPLFSIFDGVGFVDIGNVYSNVSDISFTDLRKAAGLGLRVRTPWFLLRADYGVKLDRKPGENLGRFFFSIGQAF